MMSHKEPTPPPKNVVKPQYPFVPPLRPGVRVDQLLMENTQALIRVAELEAEVERLKADAGVPAPCPEQCPECEGHIFVQELSPCGFRITCQWVCFKGEWHDTWQEAYRAHYEAAQAAKEDEG